MLLSPCLIPSRLLCLGLLLGSGLLAQSAHAAEISLQQAIQWAERQGPGGRLAAAVAAEVAAGEIQAGTWQMRNPQISGSFGQRRDSSGSLPPASGGESGLRLEHELELFGQRSLRLREARSASDAARLRLEAARRLLRAQVQEAYMESVAAGDALHVARQQAELSANVGRAIAARRAAGDASDIDVTLAQVQQGSAEVQVREAEQLQQERLGSLRVLLGVEPSTPLLFTTPLAPAPAPRFIELPIEQRAELRAIMAERRRAAAQLHRLRRERLPNPVLALEAVRQQPGQRYVGVGLGFALPLWQRRQGELAAATAWGARLDCAYRQHHAEIAAEMRRTHTAVLGCIATDTIYRSTIVPAAQRQADLTWQGFRAGKLDLFRLMQSQRELREALQADIRNKMALWRAIIAYNLARAQPQEIS